MQQSSSIRFYIKLSILALYIAALVPFSESLNAVALYVVLPLAFLLSVLMKQLTGSSFFPNRYIKILFILYLWIAFTGFFASDHELVFRQLRLILGSFILSYIFSVQAIRKDSIPWLYGVYVVLYISIFIYASTNIITMIDFGDDRANDEKLNANEFAYFTFFLTFALFIISELLKGKKGETLFKVLFLFTIPLSFYVVMLSASRQALILQIPLILGLLYLRYMNKTSVTKKIVFASLTIVFAVLCWERTLSIYDNSFLKERAERDLAEESRPLLMKEALRVGLNHPIVGVGPGNYQLYSFRAQFSHCSFTELFANDGFLAVLIYTILLVSFCKRQWQCYKCSKDKVFLYFFLFGILYVVAQFFYVYYISQWLIAFFILVASHSEVYCKEFLKLKV